MGNARPLPGGVYQIMICPYGNTPYRSCNKKPHNLTRKIGLRLKIYLCMMVYKWHVLGLGSILNFCLVYCMICCISRGLFASSILFLT